MERPALARTPAPNSARPRRLLPWGAAALTAGLGLTAALWQPATLPREASAAGVDLGGLSLAAAERTLDGARLPAPQVTVRAENRAWTLSAARLGWAPDARATVAALREKRATLFSRLVNTGPVVGQLIVKVDLGQAKTALAEAAAPVERPARDAEIFFDKAAKRYALRPEAPGLRADAAKAAEVYAADPSAISIVVPTSPVPARLAASAVQLHVDEGNRLMRSLALSLRGAPGKLTLSPVQVANLYWVREGGIELDERTIEKAVQRANDELGRPAADARFVPEKGRLVPVREERGLLAVPDQAIAALRAAVTQPEVRTLELPSRTDEPTFTFAGLPDPTKLKLIAAGRSTYLGSGAERAQNIAVAARKLTGYVVPAGGEFSFLRALGRISTAGGFVSGLIIDAGRTVAGVGGGVCQVSTTAFRALYGAGLPIIERNPHAYRVGWYEPQVGFEAAVYDPGADLRMKNDTGGPLLVRAVNDRARGVLEVRLYGIPQTRQVKVSPAVIESRIPAPPPQTVENPALPPGARRQVDWAADGYDLYITRTITRGGERRTEKLSTSYQPWRAVFEVGPGKQPKAGEGDG